MGKSSYTGIFKHDPNIHVSNGHVVSKNERPEDLDLSGVCKYKVTNKNRVFYCQIYNDLRKYTKLRMNVKEFTAKLEKEEVIYVAAGKIESNLIKGE